jgi:hypothetical protein
VNDREYVSDPTKSEFERFAREFLSAHASVVHEWRDVRDKWGVRRDLVFPPPAAGVPEVFASLLDVQIAVGDESHHEDFEDFGRGLTDEEVARRAFEKLVDLLRGHGYLSE